MKVYIYKVTLIKHLLDKHMKIKFTFLVSFIAITAIINYSQAQTCIPPNAQVSPMFGFICKGETTVLKVNRTKDATYQWQKSGKDILGATDTLFFAKDTGSYNVVVSKTKDCFTKSMVVRLNEGFVIKFMLQPSNNGGAPTLCEGDSVTLTILGGGNNGYQWYNEGTAINGATKQTLKIKTTGKYYAKVTPVGFGCGGYTDTASLKATPKPAIPIISQMGDSLISSVTAKSYMWLMANNNPTGVTTKSFKPFSSGEYKVRASNDGCSSTSEAFKYTLAPLSVERSHFGNAITLFPNPCKDVLNISATEIGVEGAVVSIFNSNGIKIMEQNFTKNFFLNTSHFTSGLYMVRVKKDNVDETYKLIKE